MPYIINKLSKILKTLLIGFSISNIDASVPYFNNQYGDDFFNKTRVNSLFDLIKSDKPFEQDCDQFVKSLFQLIKDGAIPEDRLKKMLEILASPNNIRLLKTLVKRMDDAINSPLPGLQNNRLLGDRAIVEKLLGLVFSDCELLKRLLTSSVVYMRVFSEVLLTMICKQAIDTSALYDVLSAVEDSGNVDKLIEFITFNVFDGDKFINTMDSAGYVFSKGDQLDNFLEYLSSKSDSAVGLLLYIKLIATVSERMPIDDNPQLAISNLTYMYDKFVNYICNNEYIKERGIEPPKEDPNDLNRLNMICNDTQKIELLKIKDFIIKFLIVSLGFEDDYLLASEKELSQEDKSLGESFGKAAYLAAYLAKTNDNCRLEFLNLLDRLNSFSNVYDFSDIKFKAMCLNGFLKIISNYYMEHMEGVKMSIISSYQSTELTASFPPAPIEYAQPNYFWEDTIPYQVMQSTTGTMRSIWDSKESRGDYTLGDRIPDLPPPSTNPRKVENKFAKKEKIIKKFDKEGHKEELKKAEELRELRRRPENNRQSSAFFAVDFRTNEVLYRDSGDDMNNRMYSEDLDRAVSYKDLNSAINALYHTLSIDVKEDDFHTGVLSSFNVLKGFGFNKITPEDISLYVPDSILNFATNLNDHKALLQQAYDLY